MAFIEATAPLIIQGVINQLSLDQWWGLSTSHSPIGCRAGGETEGATKERGKGEPGRDAAHAHIWHDDWEGWGSTDGAGRRKAAQGLCRQVEGHGPWAAERHPQRERRATFGQTGEGVSLQHNAAPTALRDLWAKYILDCSCNTLKWSN